MAISGGGDLNVVAMPISGGGIPKSGGGIPNKCGGDKRAGDADKRSPPFARRPRFGTLFVSSIRILAFRGIGQ